MGLQSHFRSANYTAETEPRNDSKKEKRIYGKVRNNKTMLKILSFIRILCLKNKAIFCFAFAVKNLKKRLFSNKFFSFIFRSKFIVHTA